MSFYIASWDKDSDSDSDSDRSLSPEEVRRRSIYPRDDEPWNDLPEKYWSKGRKAFVARFTPRPPTPPTTPKTKRLLNKLRRQSEAYQRERAAMGLPPYSEDEDEEQNSKKKPAATKKQPAAIVDLTTGASNDHLFLEEKENDREWECDVCFEGGSWHCKCSAPPEDQDEKPAATKQARPAPATATRKVSMSATKGKPRKISTATRKPTPAVRKRAPPAKKGKGLQKKKPRTESRFDEVKNAPRVNKDGNMLLDFGQLSQPTVHKNWQGFPIKDCYREPTLCMLLYKPKNYGKQAYADKELPRPFQFCEHCLLKPCLTLEMKKAVDEQIKKDGGFVRQYQIADIYEKAIIRYYSLEYLIRRPWGGGLPYCCEEDTRRRSRRTENPKSGALVTDLTELPSESESESSEVEYHGDYIVVGDMKTEFLESDDSDVEEK